MHAETTARPDEGGRALAEAPGKGDGKRFSCNSRDGRGGTTISKVAGGLTTRDATKAHRLPAPKVSSSDPRPAAGKGRADGATDDNMTTVEDID